MYEELFMKIIGLTGRSGSGKSAFCNILERHGIPCLDTDAVARRVVEKGMPCLDELCIHFGEHILLSNGSLDRKKLGSIAFSDKNALSALNSITHRHITAEVKKWLAECEKNGAVAAVIDAPMLFESRENEICDITVAVVCDEKSRLERIISRDGITREYAEKRMSAQKPDSFFIEKCDHIIYNNGSEKEFEKNAKAFLKTVGIISGEDL